MNGAAPFAERNGWKLFRSAAFIGTFEALTGEVDRLRQARPDDWATHPKVKLLTRIRDLIFEEIPRDPNSTTFSLGNTLGAPHRHWRRTKFMQRFRLFFRFDSASRITIYAWVNDETTLRKAGAKSDPYAVFKRRLSEGDPPDSWDDLLAEAELAEARFASGPKQARKT